MNAECPDCGSPLEDNGRCSDVGSNNCQYQDELFAECGCLRDDVDTSFCELCNMQSITCAHRPYGTCCCS